MKLDKERYKAFGAYLADIGMIKKVPAIKSIAHELAGNE